MESKQTNAAMGSYQEAIRLDPTLAGPHVNLAAVYNTMGRYADGLKAAQAGLKLNPKSAIGHYQLAIAYLKSGDLQRAEAQQRLLVGLNPELAKELQRLLQN